MNASFGSLSLLPHVSSVFSSRIRKFLKTLSRLEIFLSDTNTYTCGRSYPEICEYAYFILLDPVFTASIINKHGVQQRRIFFVNCSDFLFDILRSDKCSRDKSTQTILQISQSVLLAICLVLYSFVTVSSSSTSSSCLLYVSAYFFLTFSEDLDIFSSDELQALTIYTL